MRIVTRILLPLLLLLFSGTPALAQSGPWTVSEVKGVVTVVDARGQRPATVGTALAAGATIRTDSRASAVLVRGKEFVTMRQNAQLRIAPAERERGIIQILQDYGSALFNIGKQPNPHFGVETPYLAAVVKGTTFVITVSREGASLQVTEGAVETSTLDGGARDLIRPGAVAMIAAADPLRMVVEGEGRRVIDSPARPAGGASAGSPPPAASLRPAAYEPSGAYDRGRPRIGEAILSTPRDLGEVTGGFVSGEVVVLAAVVVADNTGRGNAAPVGNSRGRADDGVVCANGTCGAGGDRGGGSGDNGNPGGGGNGNGNPGGGGNGDGNPGGGGNGNPGGGGNGDGNPDGGGNGNGNPGGGGNGNGNPGGGGNGNGNPGGGGNGDGNPGGGGNGNGNPGGGGNGNGNGNPGGGGNGDGNPGGGGNGNGNPGGGGNGDGNPGGGGNGNGNPGGGGNGNGNPGGGGNGDGNPGGGGNGNGNPGGGGNGNGNPGGGGNGDGNPGGGGNGNGNPGGGGNGDGNPGGGGNGNGNPGGGGNGNGNPGGGGNGDGNPGGGGNGNGNPGGGGNGDGNPGGGGNGDRNPGGGGGNGGGRDPGNGNPGGGGNGGGNGPRGQSILVTEPGPVLTDMAVAYSQR
jgi:hypothetical protein